MKNILLAMMLFLVVQAAAQQEPQYTQNSFNSNLEINPAYAGINSNASINLRSRKQWNGFDGTPLLLRLAGEGKIIRDVLSAGITISSERIGITQSTQADLNIATQLRLSEKGRISVGLKAGMYMLSSDFSKLINIDPTDPLYAADKVTIPYLGFGILYYTEKFYAGFSIPRVVSFENLSTQTKISKPHTYFYSGIRIKTNNDIELRPAILGKYVSAAPFEMDFAIDAWYQNVFGIGVAYRTSDAVMMMAKARINRIYLGYSYDMTVSGLRHFNTGSHEVCLGFEFGGKGNPDRNQNNRYF